MLVAVGVAVGVLVAEATGVFVTAVDVKVAVAGAIGVDVAVDVVDVAVPVAVPGAGGVRVAVAVVVATTRVVVAVAVGVPVASAQDCKVSCTSVQLLSSRQTFAVMVVFSSARQSTSFLSPNLSITRQPIRSSSSSSLATCPSCPRIAPSGNSSLWTLT